MLRWCSSIYQLHQPLRSIFQRVSWRNRFLAGRIITEPWHSSKPVSRTWQNPRRIPPVFRTTVPTVCARARSRTQLRFQFTAMEDTEDLARTAIEEVSVIHNEVVQFASLAAPTSERVHAVASTVAKVEAMAKLLWPEARALLFGSQAAGLALPSSDLDIVLLDASVSAPATSDGFSMKQRHQIANGLDNLMMMMRRHNVLVGQPLLIRNARIPIIRCAMRAAPSLPALYVDICMGTANGVAAAALLRTQVMAVPALRPLCLVVKAVLKQRKLNEVHSGGLSSYSLVNMVLAHLQVEGVVKGPIKCAGVGRQAPGADQPEPPSISHGEQEKFLIGLKSTDYGRLDLGALLWAFFQRFGVVFDCGSECVSITQGGVVPRRGKMAAMGGAKGAGKGKQMAVEDPQVRGRDIAGGTHKVNSIRRVFEEAAEALREIQDRQAGGAPTTAEEDEEPTWEAVQADGQHQSLPPLASGSTKWSLSQLFDVGAALQGPVHPVRLQGKSAAHKKMVGLKGEWQKRKYRKIEEGGVQRQGEREGGGGGGKPKKKRPRGEEEGFEQPAKVQRTGEGKPGKRKGGKKRDTQEGGGEGGGKKGKKHRGGWITS